MKKKILKASIIFIVLITIVTGVVLVKINSDYNEKRLREKLVTLHELERVTENIDDSDSEDKLQNVIRQYNDLIRDNIHDDEESLTNKLVLTNYIMNILIIIAAFVYIYYAILRPFDKMKNFANKIAKGNFDSSLRYERSNYFGAFTWAFDSMRKEIIKARENEKKAIENNKTVIATISHDIKSPITSIRAFSEGLGANIDGDAEKRATYIKVIIKKCDVVAKLTDDLYLHSISDLDKLKIEKKPENMRKIIKTFFIDNNERIYDINLDSNIPDGTVMLDRKRIEQVYENLLGNSTKYAGTKIDIKCSVIDKNYVITIRDYGEGIPDEDMPFVFGKFYRGRNVSDKQGSGLGLYIVKYIMEKHDGSIELFNHDDGLETVIRFPIII